MGGVAVADVVDGPQQPRRDGGVHHPTGEAVLAEVGLGREVVGALEGHLQVGSDLDVRAAVVGMDDRRVDPARCDAQAVVDALDGLAFALEDGERAAEVGGACEGVRVGAAHVVGVLRQLTLLGRRSFAGRRSLGLVGVGSTALALGGRVVLGGPPRAGISVAVAAGRLLRTGVRGVVLAAAEVDAPARHDHGDDRHQRREHDDQCQTPPRQRRHGMAATRRGQAAVSIRGCHPPAP